jgi:glucosamine--fructose-6-phosphate aminotransferase (isomerizing)
MCGIIGYVGQRNATSFLLEGLTRLEYRGYDSSGLATLSPLNRTQVRRAVGAVDHLREVLAHAPADGTIGLAHTRWATARPASTTRTRTTSAASPLCTTASSRMPMS